MQAIYCTECGSKNIYSGSKPKFCSSCGHPMGISTTEKKVNNLRKKPVNKVQASWQKEKRILIMFHQLDR